MLDRRHVLRAGAASGLAIAASWPDVRPARAQGLDTVSIFVPAAPGGGWDQTARAMELALRTDKLASSIQVEHAPGAGGTVGLPKFLSTKKGQPNALLVGGMVMVGAIIANKSPVKLADAPAIARLTGEFEVVVVPASSPFKSMKDLVGAFKKEPGKISWAGGSAGGTDHIMAAMIAKAVGADPKTISYVPYSGGGPAQAALLGAQVSAGISGYGEFAEQIKAGKLRILAISADKRQEGIDAPTLKEQGVDVELYNWRGVFAAPGTTAEQRSALVALVDRMVKGPTWSAEVKKREWTSIPLLGDEFARYIDSETTRITAILKDLGLAT